MNNLIQTLTHLILKKYDLLVRLTYLDQLSILKSFYFQVYITTNLFYVVETE